MILLVGITGLEPATFWFVARYSIPIELYPNIIDNGRGSRNQTHIFEFGAKHVAITPYPYIILAGEEGFEPSQG